MFNPLFLSRQRSPYSIGQSLEGGYYCGSISLTQNGIATHHLIISPKESGEGTAHWDNTGTHGTISSSSHIDGPGNTTIAAGLGADYQCATFCKGLTINRFSDWYFPAIEELYVMFFYLKPTTASNDTSPGSTTYSVSPQPISTAWTAGNPLQTTHTNFQAGGTQCLATGYYWASTQFSSSNAYVFGTNNGGLYTTATNYAYYYVRAIRRIAI